jgi:hypothetical protein
MSLRLDEFAWASIEGESARLGVSVEEFVTFSVLYYLADVDSGRIARRISASPYPTARDDRATSPTDADQPPG